MRILLAGATGVIGRQAVPLLAAAGHQVIGLARTPARLPDAEAGVADALDAAAVADAVRSAAPDAIDPKHLARDMALTNRLRTEGTANLLAAADGASVIRPRPRYAYDPAGTPVKDEDDPFGAARRPSSPRCWTPCATWNARSHGRRAGAALRPPVRPRLQLRRRRWLHPPAAPRQGPAGR